MTLYYFAIVTIALSYTIFEFLTLKLGLEIEIGAIRKLGCGFLP